MDEMFSRALKKLASALNEKEIKWAIGGSLLLKRYGIVKTVGDIDILVSERDIEKSQLALSQFTQIKEVISKEGFSSKLFQKYRIEGVEIDVMYGLTIQSTKGIYFYPFEEECVEEVELEGVNIYYSSLLEWRNAYSYMPGREEKLKKIDIYLEVCY